MGPSGGGKSSIVKLVEQFYSPLSGTVQFDGRDVRLYNPKWLKRRVAIVNQVNKTVCQDPALMHDKLSTRQLSGAKLLHLLCSAASPHSFAAALTLRTESSWGRMGRMLGCFLVMQLPPEAGNQQGVCVSQ